MTEPAANTVNVTRRLCGVLLSATMAIGGPLVPASVLAAAPEDSDAKARAMEAFNRGTELYNQASYEEALVSFEEAATLYASPDFQYNIALCYERLEKLEQAVRHLKTYLRTADDVPDRANIEAKVEALERRLEDEAAAPEGPEGDTDGEPDPGSEVEEDPKRKKPGLALIATGSALLAVGGLGAAGGGIGLGVAVGNKNDELDAVVNGGNPDGLTFDETKAIEDEARGLQTGQFIAIGVGGALAITGVALLIVGLKQRKNAKTPKSGGDESARVQWAPTFGRQGAGLALHGRF